MSFFEHDPDFDDEGTPELTPQTGMPNRRQTVGSALIGSGAIGFLIGLNSLREFSDTQGGIFISASALAIVTGLICKWELDATVPAPPPEQPPTVVPYEYHQSEDTEIGRVPLQPYDPYGPTAG